MLGAGERLRFEFGRHETFALREGWLSKGLRRLASEGGFQADLETADALGLGSRMVKSLAYWLTASGLSSQQDGRGRPAIPSPLGEAVLGRDPWTEFSMTWWLVHLNLVSRKGSVWSWFFNDFSERTFDRTTCIDAFVRTIKEKATNPATMPVAQRDVACLLHTYATASGDDRADPEDATLSPLRSLGLVIKHAGTGRFEKLRPLDPPPIEAFLACASTCAEGAGNVAFTDLIRLRNSPGRVFGLDGDAIDQLASASVEVYGKKGVSISTLGVNRTLFVPNRSPEQWLHAHFERAGKDK
jgi:hypothetical protein